MKWIQAVIVAAAFPAARSGEDVPCQDVEAFTAANGKTRDCVWVSQKMEKRCQKYADMCLATCGNCEGGGDADAVCPSDRPEIGADCLGELECGYSLHCCPPCCDAHGNCQERLDCMHTEIATCEDSSWALQVLDVVCDDCGQNGGCADVESFDKKNGKVRDCDWVAENIDKRCPRFGHHCPVTCDLCEDDDVACPDRLPEAGSPCLARLQCGYNLECCQTCCEVNPGDPNCQDNEHCVYTDLATCSPEVDGDFAGEGWVVESSPLICTLGCDDCFDVESFEKENGKARDCGWVAENIEKRCPRFGHHCPVTCDLCFEDGEPAIRCPASSPEPGTPCPGKLECSYNEFCCAEDGGCPNDLTCLYITVAQCDLAVEESWLVLEMDVYCSCWGF